MNLVLTNEFHQWSQWKLCLYSCQQKGRWHNVSSKVTSQALPSAGESTEQVWGNSEEWINKGGIQLQIQKHECSIYSRDVYISFHCTWQQSAWYSQWKQGRYSSQHPFGHLSQLLDFTDYFECLCIAYEQVNIWVTARRLTLS